MRCLKGNYSDTPWVESDMGEWEGGFGKSDAKFGSTKSGELNIC